MSLVIYKNSTYEVLAISDDLQKFKLALPYIEGAKGFWAPASEIAVYPRTYKEITKKWIPEKVREDTYEPQVFLLEIVSALLTPNFLLAPKDPGVYTAIWMDEEDVIQVTWILYSPNDSSLSENEHLEGYDTYLISFKSWVPLRYYICNEKFRYLRFIGFNLGYTYTYLHHLIEKEHYTREEIEVIWKRDRTLGESNAFHQK